MRKINWKKSSKHEKAKQIRTWQDHHLWSWSRSCWFGEFCIIIRKSPTQKGLTRASTERMKPLLKTKHTRAKKLWLLSAVKTQNWTEIRLREEWELTLGERRLQRGSVEKPNQAFRSRHTCLESTTKRERDLIGDAMERSQEASASRSPSHLSLCIFAF